jgi:hypothetical protein
MSSNQLISIGGIVVAAAVALLIAYWQRQQMRQIELFKQNPSAGLLPPPSRLSKFIKSYRDLIVGVGVPVASLISLGDAPLTRFRVFCIALNVSLITAVITIHALMHFVGSLLDLFKNVVVFNREQVEVNILFARALGQTGTTIDVALRRSREVTRPCLRKVSQAS